MAGASGSWKKEAPWWKRRGPLLSPRALKGLLNEKVEGVRGVLQGVADIQSGKTAPIVHEPATGEVHTNPEVIERGSDIAGLLTLGAGAIPAKGINELRMGIKAYHGSPHDFDEFDFSKIGTGEGAQAYGHGGYFAENEGVAREYRDKLSRQVAYQGKPLGTHPMDNEIETAKHSVASAVANGADPSTSIRQQASEWRQAAADYRRSAKKYPEASKDAIQTAENFERIAASIKSLNPADFVKNPGRMYEVEIDAEPHELLDWDAPLDQQPIAENLRAAGLPITRESRWYEQKIGPKRTPTWTNNGYYIAENGPDDFVYGHGSAWDQDGVIGFAASKEQALAALEGQMQMPSMHGQELLQRLKYDTVGFGPSYGPETSERLKAAGVKGIRYKDAGSRGVDGEGSRNVVVFDDKLVKVLRKYGLPITAGGLATLTQMGLTPGQAQATPRNGDKKSGR